MIFALDPFTVLLTTTLSCVVLAAAMASMHFSFRREVAGVGHWACGLLVLTGAGLMFILRHHVPEGVALPIANLCLVCGIGLTRVGTRRFFGESPGWGLFHAAWVVELTAVFWWLFVTPSFPHRLMAFSFVVSIFYIDQLRLLWRYRTRHFTTWFFGVLLALQVVNTSSRGVVAMFMQGDAASLLQGSVLANIYLALANFMALLLTVSFLMLATRRLQRILEQRSTHDPLTNVLNRRGFLQNYGRAMARQKRGEGFLSMMVIDLDHFKAINDRHGHALGDQVLVHVADTILRTARRCDDVARFGGEEFVVMLPESSLSSAYQLASRIRETLAQAQRADLPRCTVSIGIASQLDADDTLDKLLSRADAALYRAKANGRDRAELAESAVLVA